MATKDELNGWPFYVVIVALALSMIFVVMPIADRLRRMWRGAPATSAQDSGDEDRDSDRKP